MVTEEASSRKNTKEQPRKEHGIDCRASDSDHAFFFKTEKESGRMFVTTTVRLLSGRTIWINN